MSFRFEFQVAGSEGLVIACALRRIAKDRIGLIDGPGALRRLFARIRVGMITPHERMIGSAYHHILGCGGHAQN